MDSHTKGKLERNEEIDVEMAENSQMLQDDFPIVKPQKPEVPDSNKNEHRVRRGRLRPPRVHSAKSFPLHVAAERGHLDELKDLLEAGKNPLQQDYKGRNSLHYASYYANQQIALKMVIAIFNSTTMLNLDNRMRLLNMQDQRGETPLHLACKAEHRKVVQLYLFSSADVNLRSNTGVQPVDLIYQHVPVVICSVFDTAITYISKHGGGTEYKSEDENAELFLNFGAIVGYDAASEALSNKEDNSYKPESALLAYSLALNSPKEKCKEILVHPLTQLFLHFKWKKIRFLFFGSIILHILWSLFCSTFIISLYVNQCPYRPKATRAEIPDEERDNLASTYHLDKNNPEIIEPVEVSDEPLVCNLAMSNVTMWAVIALAITIVMGIKESYECLTLPFRGYFKKYENYGQVSLIICLILSAHPVIRPRGVGNEILIESWHYQSAAFAIFLAWALILGQVGKLPNLGIYIEIFSKVLKSFAMFVLTFISLLTAFALSFRITMPDHPSFQSWPLAMCKVLTMMTGELEYGDFFFPEDNEDGNKTFFITGHIIFVTFTVIVTIILFNLLIGLTVSDIQGLQHDAKISGLASALERINLMEVFLERFTKLFRINGAKLKLNIAELCDDDDLGLKITLKSIPSELVEDVKQLAMDNLAKSVIEQEDPVDVITSAEQSNSITSGSLNQTMSEDYDGDATINRKCCGCNCENKLLIEGLIREILKQQNEFRN